MGENSFEQTSTRRISVGSVPPYSVTIISHFLRVLTHSMFISLVDRSKCGSKLYGLRPLIACLPAWWRFAQSLRRYDDTKQKFPHLANAGKYSTTFFVVFFSTVATTHKGITHGEVSWMWKKAYNESFYGFLLIFHPFLNIVRPIN